MSLLQNSKLKSKLKAFKKKDLERRREIEPNFKHWYGNDYALDLNLKVINLLIILYIAIGGIFWSMSVYIHPLMGIIFLPFLAINSTLWPLGNSKNLKVQLHQYKSHKYPFILKYRKAKEDGNNKYIKKNIDEYQQLNDELKQVEDFLFKTKLIGLTTTISYYFLNVFCFATYYYIDSKANFGEKLSFIESLYFSTITWTTLGYGDITPTSEITKLVCSFQAIFGQVILALLIVKIINYYENY